MSKKITIPFTEEGFSTLATKIATYQQEIEKAAHRAIERLMDEGGYLILQVTHGSYLPELSGHVMIEKKFAESQDGVTAIMMAISHDVPISYKRFDEVVTRNVNPLLMYEFGSGRFALDSAILKGIVGRGTFPDQTHAFQDSWWWKDLNDEWHENKGVTPMRPMYHAAQMMVRDCERIFREEFERIQI